MYSHAWNYLKKKLLVERRKCLLKNVVCMRLVLNLEDYLELIDINMDVIYGIFAREIVINEQLNK